MSASPRSTTTKQNYRTGRIYPKRVRIFSSGKTNGQRIMLIQLTLTEALVK